MKSSSGDFSYRNGNFDSSFVVNEEKKDDMFNKRMGVTLDPNRASNIASKSINGTKSLRGNPHTSLQTIMQQVEQNQLTKEDDFVVKKGSGPDMRHEELILDTSNSRLDLK